MAGNEVAVARRLESWPKRRKIIINGLPGCRQATGSAEVVKLVDTLRSGRSGATRGGSNPLLGTQPFLPMPAMKTRQ